MKHCGRLPALLCALLCLVLRSPVFADPGSSVEPSPSGPPSATPLPSSSPSRLALLLQLKSELESSQTLSAGLLTRLEESGVILIAPLSSSTPSSQSSEQWMELTQEIRAALRWCRTEVWILRGVAGALVGGIVYLLVRGGSTP